MSWPALLANLRNEAVRAGNDAGRVDRALALVASGRLNEQARATLEWFSNQTEGDKL